MRYKHCCTTVARQFLLLCHDDVHRPKAHEKSIVLIMLCCTSRRQRQKPDERFLTIHRRLVFVLETTKKKSPHCVQQLRETVCPSSTYEMITYCCTTTVLRHNNSCCLVLCTPVQHNSADCRRHPNTPSKPPHIMSGCCCEG